MKYRRMPAVLETKTSENKTNANRDTKASSTLAQQRATTEYCRTMIEVMGAYYTSRFWGS